jgi:hypothetical protein
MATGIHQYTSDEGVSVQLGQAGYKYIDQAGTGDTGTAVTGVEYVAVTILEGVPAGAGKGTAIIATESNDTALFPDTTFANLYTDTTIYGRWNKITITGTSCTAICYKG